MNILIVGGTGRIGAAVATALAPRHRIIIAGHQSGDVAVDITQKESIVAMYQKIGKIDAVIATTGNVVFKPLLEMTDSDYEIGLKNKLMGQINLVSIGLPYLNDAGSFTLTSGILNRDPIRQGASAAMVNGALDGFVISAALEMPRHIRINIVSPTVITEALDGYADYFRGFNSVPAARVALAYSKSVEGLQTGQVYCVE